MATRKLDVPVRDIAILVKGWDTDHGLFRIIMVQGRTVRNLIWDPKQFPEKARMVTGGRGLLTVPEDVDDDRLCILAVDAIKAFKANNCPKVKKVETLMKHLAETWLPVGVRG